MPTPRAVAGIRAGLEFLAGTGALRVDRAGNAAADIALQGQTAVLQGQTAANTSLGAGLLTPWSGRMDWATLHRRVYLHDVLACPCGGRRTVVADIHDPDAIRDALLALGLPTEPPTLARARDPTDDAA